MNEPNQMKPASYFFLVARNFVIENGYEHEVDWCRDMTPFENCTSEQFFSEYVWCVINAGMKEQVARKIYDRFMLAGDLNTIGHLGKRAAIKKGNLILANLYLLLHTQLHT